ncbi:MAG: IclR family transcriptional regulator [Acidimicrobiales bacterium]
MATAVQSVERAFSILDALGSGPATLSEIARHVDLPISTTSRLLATLEGLTAVERIDNVNLYRIGPGIVTIASGVDANRSLAALAEDELQSLAVEANEAVGLSITSGYVVHFIAEHRPETSVQLRDWVNTRLPMHLVSSGLVALASWPDDAIDNYLSRPLESRTSNSVTDPDALRRRIRKVRHDGIAWTVDELEDGITALSAPLIASSGDVVGGVYIHGPSFRFPGSRKNEFEKLVRSSAERINLLLA